MKTIKGIVTFVLTLSILSFPSFQFQSDELLVDDEEFGIEGAHQPTRFAHVTTPSRKRHSDLDSDSKIHFSLDHSFGDSDFSPAGTFSARLKTSSHGGQNLLESDDFYRIRLPSNVFDVAWDFIISSVKARCLPREGLDENLVIHMEGINVLTVNYGSPGSCPYPWNLKIPAKWCFSSYTVLKNSEQAPRAPVFSEEILGGENEEGEVVQPPERSFWAKYWMYLIPLGLILTNAVTQVMNMPEEQATGQVSAQGQPSAEVVQRGLSSAVRRR